MKMLELTTNERVFAGWLARAMMILLEEAVCKTLAMRPRARARS